MDSWNESGTLNPLGNVSVRVVENGGKGDIVVV